MPQSTHYLRLSIGFDSSCGRDTEERFCKDGSNLCSFSQALAAMEQSR